MIRGKGISLLIAVLCLSAVPAFADSIFTDSTFNLANYTTTTPFTSDSSVSLTSGQCASCGNPGLGLQLVGSVNGSSPNINGTGASDILLVNDTFSYNPATQGAITSISASVDKDLTASYSGSISNPIGNTFRPLIEQDGIYYLAAIPGPGVTGTTSGYNTISQSGLVAANFVEFDPATDTFLTGNPNFDGDSMFFGLGQVFGVPENPGVPASLTADYDNLSLTVSAPEPSSLLLMALGLVGLFAISRKRLANNATS
jgi:hypothetical protein